MSTEGGEADLRRGERIAFDLPLAYAEQTAESLQVNKEDVETAFAGNRVGVRSELGEKLREGVRVFRILDPE